jgi:hypothetical protein
VSGFGVSRPVNAKTSSNLHLLPTEGSLLVEASNAELAKLRRDKEDYWDEEFSVKEVKEPISVNTKGSSTPNTAARAFVTRLFSIPTALWSLQHEDTAMNPFETTSKNQDNDGSVVYPIIGFRWIKSGKNDYRAVPTTSKASCTLPHLRKEEEFGVFSPHPDSTK